MELSMDEKLVLIQHAIKKYEKEKDLVSKLSSVLSEKDIQRGIDTLVGTQRVRRIGLEALQNNESHVELPDLPDDLKSVVENL